MPNNNIVPSMEARGRFEAEAPFDRVVKPEVYYSVQAIHTIHEMEARKLDIYTLVFKPVGVSLEDFPVVLERCRTANAKIISLLDRQDVPTYVLTNYLTSFPLVDGVSFERMCLVVDLGPCNPNMKDIIAKEIEHIKNHVEANVGITTTVTLGTIPTLGYVSADQALAYENTRKGKITDNSNDVAKIRELEAQRVKDQAYITQLENIIANRP